MLVTRRGPYKEQMRKYLDKLASAMRVPPDKRTGTWAKGCCVASRKVHEGVWMGKPCGKHVENKIIRQLKLVSEAVLAVPKRGKHGDGIAVYAENILRRVKNLRRYVKGLPPNFAPDARLKRVTKADYEKSKAHILALAGKTDRD